MLRSGIGRAHDAVSTASRDAQDFYDQGLAYLHSFVWVEAARSFNQALRTDGRLAMAHLGLTIAYTELNAPAKAQTALERAQALAKGAPAHDQAHVEARAMQMAAEANAGDPSRLPAYRAALDRAIALYPKDAEFLLLRGVAESADPADRGQGSPASAAPFFERALAAAPGYFAAHHYLTHSFENAGLAAEALLHATAFAKGAPAVPHALHMHGHVLRRVGRIDQAVAAFEAADRLERAYLKAENVPAEHEWHYEHNLDLLASSYRYQGRMTKAEELQRAAFAVASPLVVQIVNKHEWPAFLTSRGRTAEALAAATVLVGHPSGLVRAAGAHRDRPCAAGGRAISSGGGGGQRGARRAEGSPGWCGARGAGVRGASRRLLRTHQTAGEREGDAAGRGQAATSGDRTGRMGAGAVRAGIHGPCRTRGGRLDDGGLGGERDGSARPQLRWNPLRAGPRRGT